MSVLCKQINLFTNMLNNGKFNSSIGVKLTLSVGFNYFKNSQVCKIYIIECSYLITIQIFRPNGGAISAQDVLAITH